MAKINIVNEEHLQEAWKFANTLDDNSRLSFLNCLVTINRIKRNYSADTVNIFPDFVKHSFEWSIIKDKNCVYHGGMILHGFEETFSVELNPASYPHWSIHT